MELQSSSKQIIYVAAYSANDFKEFQRQHPELECLYIDSENFLRGRVWNSIYEVAGVEERWDWQGILESIERFKAINAHHKETEQLKKDGTEAIDIDYGGFD